jgi:hypothetical protein
MVCDNGHCMIGNCTIPEDCGPPPECKVWDCIDNQCTEQNSSTGGCDDENPCTVNDYCLSGICQPGPDVPDCTHEDDWCNTGICVVINPDTYDCEKSPLPAGTPCAEDGLDCTTEECNGGHAGNPGQCVYTGVASGDCFIDGVCYDNNDLSPNGCGICQSTTSQTEWQPVAGGTPCGSDPCDQLCSGTNCIDRWWYRPQQCALAIPPYPILRCILDRVTDRYYFYRGTCNSGCYCRATYTDAVAACEALDLRLPTLAEYEAISVSGCMSEDCSEPPIDMQVDPEFDGRIQAAFGHWTSDYPQVIFYLSTGPLVIPDATPSRMYNYMCIEE